MKTTEITHINEVPPTGYRAFRASEYGANQPVKMTDLVFNGQAWQCITRAPRNLLTPDVRSTKDGQVVIFNAMARLG